MYKSINMQLQDSLTSMLRRTEKVLNHTFINYNGYYIQHITTNIIKFIIIYSEPVF